MPSKNVTQRVRPNSYESYIRENNNIDMLLKEQTNNLKLSISKQNPTLLLTSLSISSSFSKKDKPVSEVCFRMLK